MFNVLYQVQHENDPITKTKHFVNSWSVLHVGLEESEPIPPYRIASNLGCCWVSLHEPFTRHFIGLSSGLWLGHSKIWIYSSLTIPWQTILVFLWFSGSQRWGLWHRAKGSAILHPFSPDHQDALQRGEDYAEHFVKNITKISGGSWCEDIRGILVWFINWEGEKKKQGKIKRDRTMCEACAAACKQGTIPHKKHSFHSERMS